MVYSFNACFKKWSEAFQNRFENLGVFIAKYPKILIPLCIIITAGLSCGMITLTSETSIEVLYTPINSIASMDRQKYQATFQDKSDSYYVDYALTADEVYGEMIFTASDGNVFSNITVEELKRHIAAIKNMNTTYNGKVITFNDVCGLRNGVCFVSGEFLTTDDMVSAYRAGNLTYPVYKGQSLKQYLGEVDKTSDSQLQSAKYLKVRFGLRQHTALSKAMANTWEEEFLKTVPTLSTSAVTIDYATSGSIDAELNKNVAGDIMIFAVTFGLMITYATLVAGGDAVSSRIWAACAGVLAALFGILSSFGLVSLCGLDFVDIVGVVPFLIIGIGVDDMFLLMSGWADTYCDDEVNIVNRMGKTFRSAGIGITITSLTDLLAFVIGASSVFVAVRNFCVYTGVAIIFSYFYQCFFFGSCLAIHGRRVDDGRHCITCRKTQSRRKLREEGKSKCTVLFCGGSRPTHRGQDERFVENLPRKYLPVLILNKYGFTIVILLFLGYLATSIWGIINFEQGLVLKNLVSPSSYYYRYAETNENHFENIIPVPIVFDTALNYIDSDTVTNIEAFFDNAESDSDINNESLICWFHSYRAYPLYDNSTLTTFVSGLNTFLESFPIFKNDVILDSSNSTITTSRCYLFSNNIRGSNRPANLMLRMRSLADFSPLSVFVFHPVYILLESDIAILPNTIQTVGITLAVMAVITFIFLPHPLLMLLVVLNIVSILIGIFGFLHIWDLTLSSITMIHLIMSVGFSVDFSVHVCSAYMLGEGETRKDKVKSAITHAAGPILNGGMSSFLGIIVLVFSRSYIFNAFFKIMFTVILFGMVHAVLFLPVILCLCGPLSSSNSSKVTMRPYSNDKLPSVSFKIAVSSSEVLQYTESDNILASRAYDWYRPNAAPRATRPPSPPIDYPMNY